jgi:hypothetical protein
MNIAYTDPGPLLAAVDNNDLDLVNHLVHSGESRITEESGWRHYTALEGAILHENCDMIDLILKLGENIHRVHKGCDPYDFAIRRQKYSALAHLIRRGGYPVTKRGDLEHMDIARKTGNHQAVSILERERDVPNFWSFPENARYDKHHVDISNELAEKTMKAIASRTKDEQFQLDIAEHASIGPPHRRLYSLRGVHEDGGNKRIPLDSEEGRQIMANAKEAYFRRYERSTQ